MSATSHIPARPDSQLDAVSELWYTRCPVPTASSIAISQGWLDDEFAPDGIGVASLRASSDDDVRESHFDHTQANSFRQGGNIPPIWARSRGGDVRLIGLSWVPQFQAIVAMPDSGITEPADLRGKRLALPRRLNDKIDFWRATALHGYVDTLAQAGLTIDDVTLVDMPVGETFLGHREDSERGSLFGAYSNRRLQSVEVLALIRGEVDAVYTAGGRGPDLLALTGAHVVYDIAAAADRRSQVNNITPAALTVSGALLDSRPDLVVRYLAATIRAARWAVENRAATTRILAHEIGIAEEFVEPGYTAAIQDLLEPSLDDELIDTIEIQKRFLLDWGFIERDFDVPEWVAVEPLRQARELVDREDAAASRSNGSTSRPTSVSVAGTRPAPSPKGHAS
jgi:ABC-type nitrate/sulfonate/bicarbonate transport system substrate-binding protein